MSKPPAPASLLSRIFPKLLISLVLGGLFIWIYRAGGVPLLPSREQLAAVQWWAVPAYLGLLSLTHFLRASRWRFLIRPVKEIPLREVIALNWIGFFTIFALPLRIGEVTRPALTKIRHQIPISVGFGTIAVERVVDGLLTSFCVAWALFALPRLEVDDPLVRSLPVYGYATLAVFGGAFLALGAFLWQRRLAIALTERLVGLVSPRLATFIAEKVDGVAEGIRSLADVKLTGLFLLETLAYWATNALGMWVLAIGCGLPIGPGHAVAIMGILAIGILLPAGPGLFGNFQLAISKGLAMYLAHELVAGPGAVYVFLLYSIQTVFIVLCGVVPLLGMKVTMGDLLGQGLMSGPARAADPSGE